MSSPQRSKSAQLDAEPSVQSLPPDEALDREIAAAVAQAPATQTEDQTDHQRPGHSAQTQTGTQPSRNLDAELAAPSVADAVRHYGTHADVPPEPRSPPRSAYDGGYAETFSQSMDSVTMGQ
ncbi:hypothetical protein GN958_ATG12037 [Phytophthora infestans]|uniref:Uncharacterized protein n=1 Tax=Phytophthora infestans TaxID=4787 RepID=A0A8S9U6R4_PHYIN|nr:hypothetical protein GN958_ATG14581 [Phytophthora infestans]KAF4138828.1 hypothetical protein GN958_ATG12037 [Phytophthora infestans]